jgi:NhaP-type Na+/H+ or K+/H+ antiporter
MRSNFSVSSALLFGSINAAVDPVAVLAVFEEIHVNKLLHILVFGESLLNDAVVIVLFQVLGSFANIPFDTGRDELENQQAIDIVVGIFQFILVIIASMIIGFLMGVFGSLLSRFTQYIHVLEPVVVFIIGYLAYLLADLFAFSGIISLIVCSIIMKHYIPANFTWKSNITTKYCLKMIRYNYYNYYRYCHYGYRCLVIIVIVAMVIDV